jgi:hypothetical protein
VGEGSVRTLPLPSILATVSFLQGLVSFVLDRGLLYSQQMSLPGFLGFYFHWDLMTVELDVLFTVCLMKLSVDQYSIGL